MLFCLYKQSNGTNVVVCGTSATATLSSATLTISGTGTVTSTPWSAYKDNIQTIKINSGITVIPSSAFYNCTGLTSVTNNATTPQSINANVFGGVTINTIPLHVPAASLALYKAAPVWKDFFGMQTAIETPETDKFSVFPNPAKDEIFIRSEQPVEKVEIWDIFGRAVETLRVEALRATPLQQSGNVQTISVSHLPKGVYFVKIFVGSQSITKKIIRE